MQDWADSSNNIHEVQSSSLSAHVKKKKKSRQDGARLQPQSQGMETRLLRLAGLPAYLLSGSQASEILAQQAR